MKRFLSSILALILMTTSALAGDVVLGSGSFQNLTITTKTNSPDAELYSLLAYGSIRLYKNLEKLSTGMHVASDLNADYAEGSATATFTVTRDATHPMTYVDDNCVVQTTTTSNQARVTYGFYDEYGCRAKKMVLYEGASTNLVPKSAVINDATWTVSNGTTVNADAGSSSPDGTATAPSFTSTDVNATLLLTTAVTAQTYSVWLKPKTGTGAVYITANGGTAWTAVTLVPNTWARFQVTAASASQTCGIKLATSGDAVYVWGNQFENKEIATTYIPTTNGALSRNEETFRYPEGVNRNAAEESAWIKYVPWFTYGTTQNYGIVGSVSTQDRSILYAGATFNFYPNQASGPTVAKVLNHQRGLSYVVGYSCISTSSKSFFQGTLGTSSGTAWTVPAMADATMTMGKSNGNNFPFYGGFQKIVIYASAQSANNTAITKLLSLDQPQMLTLGDSITYNLEYYGNMNTMVGRKYQRVGSFLDTTHYWYTAGVPADTSTLLLARIDNELALVTNNISTSKRVYWIHIGTNDVSGGTDYATYVGNVQAVLDKIVAFDAVSNIYVCLIIPHNDANDSRVTAYNSALNTMLLTYRAAHPQVKIIDMNGAFKANANWAADYMADALHPSTAGYNLMMSTWKAALIANGDW